jgi:hypothetical protein
MAVRTRLAAAAVGVAVSAGGGVSAATLEFDGIRAFYDDLIESRPPEFDVLTGIYRERGFAVELSTVPGAPDEVKDGLLGLFSGFGGGGSLFDPAIFRREDGQTFKLRSFGVHSIQSSLYGYLNYYDASDLENSFDQVVYLQWPNLRLTGEKRSGEIVATTISAWRDSVENIGSLETIPYLATEFPRVANGFWVADPDSPYFTPDLARSFTAADYGDAFTDLVELKLEFVDLETRFIDPYWGLDVLCAPVNFSRVDSVFQTSTLCDDPGSTYTVILPNGAEIWAQVTLGPRNDEGYVQIERVVAPVPLPPALGLMLAGLGTIAAVGRRRRRLG